MDYFTCSLSATSTTIICIIFYIFIVCYIIYIVFAKFYATLPLANNSCVYTVLSRIYHLYLISTLRDYAITGVVSFQFDRWGNWNMNRMSWHTQCLTLVEPWNTQSQLPLQGPFPPLKSYVLLKEMAFLKGYSLSLKCGKIWNDIISRRWECN